MSTLDHVLSRRRRCAAGVISGTRDDVVGSRRMTAAEDALLVSGAVASEVARRHRLAPRPECSHGAGKHADPL